MVECSTSTAKSGAIVLLPKGRLEMMAASDLRKQLHALIQGGSLRLVIDLSRTDSIDSSGLGALISGLKAARHAGGDLRIAAPNKQVAAVLDLTNLNRILIPHETADVAFDESA